ncbi:MAG TPA: hypothetical protein VGZ23_15200 [bacterium]|nr:hypothetical protein [bacterium]
MSVIARAVASGSETNGHGPLVAATPASALAMAELGIAELLDSLYANGLTASWSGQDIAILEAAHEAVSAAHRRFQALRAGREHDVGLWTARLQAAARHLSEAALGL